MPTSITIKLMNNQPLLLLQHLIYAMNSMHEMWELNLDDEIYEKFSALIYTSIEIIDVLVDIQNKKDTKCNLNTAPT